MNTFAKFGLILLISENCKIGNAINGFRRYGIEPCDANLCVEEDYTTAERKKIHGRLFQ